jgi:hypothetical protein
MAEFTVLPREDRGTLGSADPKGAPRNDYLEEAFPLILLLLTLSIALLQYQAVHWNSTYFGGDTIYPLNPQLDIHRLWTMWDDAQLGRPSLYPALPIFFGWFWLCSVLGFTVGFAENSLHFTCTVVAGLGAAGLALEICPWTGRRRTVCALGSAAAYMLLPTAAALPVGWTVTTGIALCIWSFIRALNARTALGFIGAGVLGWGATVLFMNDVPNFQIPLMQLAWYVMLLFALWRVGTRIERLALRVAGYLIFAFGTTLPLIVGLAWQILPSYAASAAMTPARIGTGATYGDLGHTLLSNTMTLMAYYPSIYWRPIISVAALIPPILAGLSLRLRSPWTVGIGLCTTASILAVVGPNAPTGALYNYLVTHVPGGLAFRTTGKLLLFVALGYAALCPIGCFAAADLLRTRLTQASLLIWAIFASALLAVGHPILTGALFSQPAHPDDVLRKVPDSLHRFAEILEGSPQRALLIPEAGYLEESLSGVEYFGPSLTTYMFPTRVVQSRSGTYGQPANPFIRRLYGMMDAVEPTRWLVSPKGRMLTHYAVSSGDAITVNSVGLLTWVLNPKTRSHYLDMGPFSALSSGSASSPAVVGAFVRTGSGDPSIPVIATLTSGNRLISRARFAATAISKSEALSTDSMEAMEIPNSQLRKRDLHLRLAVMITPGWRPRSVSIYLLGIRRGFTDEFYRALRRANIRYVYLDAGINTLGAIGLEAVLKADRHFTRIAADHDRRYLFRFEEPSSFIRFCSARECTRVASPGYLPDHLDFNASSPGKLIISQTYSPLWSITARSRARTRILRSRPLSGPFRFGQEIDVPEAGSYVLSSFYRPQALLVIQWIVWIGLAFLAFGVLCCHLRRGPQLVLTLSKPVTQYWLSGVCGVLAAIDFTMGRAEASSWLIIVGAVFFCIASLAQRLRSASTL